MIPTIIFKMAHYNIVFSVDTYKGMFTHHYESENYFTLSFRVPNKVMVQMWPHLSIFDAIINDLINRFAIR